MAFVDFAHPPVSPGAMDATKPVDQRLDHLQREAVLLARTDPLRSVRPVGAVLRLARRLLGLHGPTKLADTRLEALRTFAVVTARSRSGDADDAELTALGYSAPQVAQARCMALRYRRPLTTRAQAIHTMVAAATSFMTYLLIHPVLEDSMVTAMVSACLNLTWLSLVKPRAGRA